MHVEVPSVPEQAMFSMHCGEPSIAVRERVIAAREVQIERQAVTNARLATNRIDRGVQLDAGADRLIRLAASRLERSLRACHRVLKVARTIADLDHPGIVREQHVGEALRYRSNA